MGRPLGARRTLAQHMAGSGEARANINLNSSPSESDSSEFQVDLFWARVLAHCSVGPSSGHSCGTGTLPV